MKQVKLAILPLISICIFFFIVSGCSGSIPTGEYIQETIACPTCVPTAVAVQNTPTPVKMTATETVQTSQPEIVVVYPKHIIEDHEKGHYTLDVEYPYMGGSDETAMSFNQVIDDSISKDINMFKESATDEGELDFIENQWPDADSSLYIDQNITGVFANTISVRFQISYFIVGAAHPNHYSYSINYDFEKNRHIELADLFLPDTDYLKILSENSIESLISNDYINNDSEWLKTGAAPIKENFKTWNITPEGILITFDPYQVAPYAAGTQEVTIPFSQFESIIDDNSLIRNILEESASNQSS